MYIDYEKNIISSCLPYKTIPLLNESEKKLVGFYTINKKVNVNFIAVGVQKIIFSGN
jgi:hypothetical protein